MEAKRAAITNRTAENATQNVVAVRVSRLDTVRNSKTQRPDVVSDDPEGDVSLHLVWTQCSKNLSNLRPSITPFGMHRQRGRIVFTAHFLQSIKNWSKNVRLVVRDLRVGEIFEIVRTLDDAGGALKTHAGIHVLRGQRRERSVRI